MYSFAVSLRKQAEALDAAGQREAAQACWDELDAELADMRYQERTDDARADRNGWND